MSEKFQIVLLIVIAIFIAIRSVYLARIIWVSKVP